MHAESSTTRVIHCSAAVLKNTFDLKLGPAEKYAKAFELFIKIYIYICLYMQCGDITANGPRDINT